MRMHSLLMDTLREAYYYEKYYSTHSVVSVTNTEVGEGRVFGENFSRLLSD